MKKLFTTLILLAFISEVSIAASVNTDGWACCSDCISIEATELELKSELKSDYKLYHASINNKTKQTADITIQTNVEIKNKINEILNNGVTVKELMTVPKQIAVDSYNEDVGEGAIAKAHKGLIYVCATAGAAITGLSFIGMYPQQKLEEHITKRKIKKEYNQVSDNLLETFILSPFEERDVYIFMPITQDGCFINSSLREEQIEVNSDYQQI